MLNLVSNMSLSGLNLIVQIVNNLPQKHNIFKHKFDHPTDAKTDSKCNAKSLVHRLKFIFSRGAAKDEKFRSELDLFY